MANKMVYYYGGAVAEGDASMKNLLGGKGANLAEMAKLGIPVPAGFTITTEICTAYYDNNRQYPPGLEAEVDAAMARVEAEMGAKFGDAENPLLVSVRSGARVSMPGMMDTVLNLGLNDTTVQGIIKQSGNERFAWDSYRRFLQMFGDVVLEVDHHHFEHALESLKKARGVALDTELSADDMKGLVATFKSIIENKTGQPFPESPKDQLWAAIGAVFNSWMNDRANTYRRLHDIPESWGTAVSVCAMVFGNMGDDCATGVAFTRDPSTGEHVFFGEFLINAQGEDVVAGIRTPQQITQFGSREWALSNGVSEADRASRFSSLEEAMPGVYGELVTVYKRLEDHYRDMQDIEFTIQNNRLWLLQTRNGKRTIRAGVKIAVDMVDEGMITKEQAVGRIEPERLDQLLHPTLDPNAEKKVIARGLPASPGAATGKVVFHADDAMEWAEKGEHVILVRIETSPEDIHGMHAAQGILTARGGTTSHAAVVARGMGRCCVSGCGEIQVDYESEVFNVGYITVSKGDWITLDGSTGEIMTGRVPTRSPELSGEFGRLMGWVDEIRTLKVRTNADTPHDAQVAREFGAEGIGLCRTEHMFFDGDRITAVREMILADDVNGRRKALDKLLPMQREDFHGIFKAMKGYPCTIRLLDPPLHEFLPHTDEEIAEVARASGAMKEKLKEKVAALHEFNPMLGHRGCRLAITYPEIYEMQVRAIMEAACELVKNDGFSIIPEIMIPLVGKKQELSLLKKQAVAVADQVLAETGVELEYMIGTMIELPRAAITADLIAEEAQFFSFGTNDLTQTSLGISRDDAGSFIGEYVRKGIYEKDPFVSIDVGGVGMLVKMGVEKGRATRPNIKLGICGEHGGDPASVHFFNEVGLDYVSCSPFRVPIARLAAAQAVLAKRKG